VVVVVIAGEKESSEGEESGDEVIASYFFPEGHDDDDIDREDKNPLPPTEDTYRELIVELVSHRKCGREDSDNTDHFHVEKIVDF
jgi:hypothetical protein